MKYSDMVFPLESNPICSVIGEMWKKGWLDSYERKHFLIRCILGDNNYIRQFFCNQKYTYEGRLPIQAETFVMNLSTKLGRLIDFFGEEHIKNFIINQMSAGKKHYNQNKFFQALSEVEILIYFISFGPTYTKKGQYEPPVNQGKKNPEAKISYADGTVLTIEVKMPEFQDVLQRKDTYMPLVLLNEKGRKEFSDLCTTIGEIYKSPRVLKLKEFLNSACEKFEVVEDENHFNVLFINWTFTDIPYNGYFEACELLYNEWNGLLKYPNVAKKMGISEELFKKVSAVFVYQDPDEMMIFQDFRFLFASKKAALLTNPFLITNESQEMRLRDIMNFHYGDFRWDKDLLINFSVEHPHKSVLRKMEKIVVDNLYAVDE